MGEALGVLVGEVLGRLVGDVLGPYWALTGPLRGRPCSNSHEKGCSKKGNPLVDPTNWSSVFPEPELQHRLLRVKQRRKPGCKLTAHSLGKTAGLHLKSLPDETQLAPHHKGYMPPLLLSRPGHRHAVANTTQPTHAGWQCRPLAARKRTPSTRQPWGQRSPPQLGGQREGYCRQHRTHPRPKQQRPVAPQPKL